MPALLRQWIDITLAAWERNGRGFFKKCPQAYFLDNVKNANQGTRTPPDWWLEMRKDEVQFHRSGGHSKSKGKAVPSVLPESVRDILPRIFP